MSQAKVYERVEKFRGTSAVVTDRALPGQAGSSAYLIKIEELGLIKQHHSRKELI
jgi:hypothetical protein